MFWVESDRTRRLALRTAVAALCVAASIDSSFAQSEPPLNVPLAGPLPSPSSGCEPGIASGRLLYSPAGTTNGAPPGANSATKTTSEFGVPLYGSPDAGTNIPLYSNPLAGDNEPLYAQPILGQNTPLFSNSSLNTNYNNFGAGNAPVSTLSSSVCRSGIPVGEWLVYPSLRLYSIYSNNLFLAPSNRLNAWGFGATPSVTAQWTNGIHSTTIFANIDRQQYPTDNSINTLDGEATWTQKYSPLPDLIFTAAADYTHRTVASPLTNSIPGIIETPVTVPTLLPNGDTELPNGEIISPTGQVVGNINSSSNNGQNLVNPYNQYTVTESATKIFNGAILTVSDSSAKTDYQFLQNPGGTGAYSSFRTNTVRENGSFALGPIVYAYSTGAFSTRTNAEGTDPYSQTYRIEGGLGTTQFAQFRSNLYYGYQGSDGDGSGISGGLLYGGRLIYYPSYVWTITASVDETINKAAGTGVSTQALDISSPEQIPLSSSTRITHPALQTQYQIAPQWTASGNVSYTQIDYYGSPRLDHSWQAEVALNYDIRRNLTLTWEYEYTVILSNAPGQSARRHFVTMSANYNF